MHMNQPQILPGQAQSVYSRQTSAAARGQAGHLIPFSHAAKVSRGLATGANHYFLFSQEKADACEVPDLYLTPCLTRSSYVKHCVFTHQDFLRLKNTGRNVYVLDIPSASVPAAKLPPALTTYLEKGLSEKVNKKYLPAHRNPWYIMEQKNPAPIWISAASRSEIKVIRNLTGIRQLTTFHGVHVKDEFSHLTNIIFCYLLTPLAQQLLYQNRKIMGSGLTKFQPNDINHALSINFANLTKQHIEQIESWYQMLLMTGKIPVEELNQLFSDYC